MARCCSCSCCRSLAETTVQADGRAGTRQGGWGGGGSKTPTHRHNRRTARKSEQTACVLLVCVVCAVPCFTRRCVLRVLPLLSCGGSGSCRPLPPGVRRDPREKGTETERGAEPPETSLRASAAPRAVWSCTHARTHTSLSVFREFWIRSYQQTSKKKGLKSKERRPCFCGVRGPVTVPRTGLLLSLRICRPSVSATSQQASGIVRAYVLVRMEQMKALPRSPSLVAAARHVLSRPLGFFLAIRAYQPLILLRFRMLN